MNTLDFLISIGMLAVLVYTPWLVQKFYERYRPELLEPGKLWFEE